MGTTARGLAAFLLLVAIASLPFLGAVRGEFVYDDRLQILENSLIQQPDRLAEALTRDVWAFKGERVAAWSNYYRPAFVLWLAVQWRLFGAHPMGWHLANLALHATVALIALLLLRRLGFQPVSAWLCAAIFAAHPAHVESVAWISGAPDLLMALGVLGCLALEAQPDGGARGSRRLAALALGVLALCSKEAAVLLPFLVAALAWTLAAGSPRSLRARAALRAATPYAGLAVIFLAARQAVIGGFATPTPWALGWVDLAISLPGVAVFYLRQIFVPLWIGPTYPLRPITLTTTSWTNFALPLLILAAVSGLFWAATRRSPQRTFCFALALLPLLPAFHLGAFMQEQIVHDRYLYLPVFGWIGLAALAITAVRDRTALSSERQPALSTGLALALIAFLAARTAALAQDYRDERNLFRAAVAADPGSSFHWAQLAATEYRLGDFAAASVAANRALALGPVTSAFLVRADLAARERRFAEAASDLEAVLTAFPDQTAAIERLAIVYTSQGRNTAAIDLLRRSRATVPWRRCSLTGNLAVVLYLEGRREEAAAELEGLRAADTVDPSPACGLALFRLGSLYLELGRGAEARSAFEDYLRASAASTSTYHDAPRHEARKALDQLPGAPSSTR